ncbi:3285_t:CDS:2 [Paraglomus brasilianum]|uniref:3285_t:CDS:1 n=1 Tax=Paraglomus brasilianum TaxID=144538 RepID=A0A9N9DN65_9GLOM|nr:3285_t:CDS:2 [Paraglomus brasilianum]
MLDESVEARQAMLNNANREVYRRTYLSSFRKMLKRSPNRTRNSATPSPTQPSSPVDRRASLIGNSPDGIISITDLQMMMIDSKLYKLQQLLSLETTLHMIHLNKESLRRAGCLVGYPDKMGLKVQETLESIFITLLETLGTLHIKPGFDIALRHIGEHKPDVESTNTGLASLVEFFELVHIVDLIQQMIQVYYDEEMCRFVDKHDFLSRCNKEKKRFEKILDESVAAGLNKGIQALMDQAEFILMTEQQPEDFRPANNTPLELKPSKACIHTVQCLEAHAKLVAGCADQHTLDVFYQEIGLRFFSVLLKHLKKFVVSIDGGFQVISDLNHYTSFIMTLQQSSITPFFIALKEMGSGYIISTAKDVGLFIREAERFKGILRAEDVYEFVQMREDWAEIKKEVEKQLFGLKAEDCVVM